MERICPTIRGVDEFCDICQDYHYCVCCYEPTPGKGTVYDREYWERSIKGPIGRQDWANYDPQRLFKRFGGD